MLKMLRDSEKQKEKDKEKINKTPMGLFILYNHILRPILFVYHPLFYPRIVLPN